MIVMISGLVEYYFLKLRFTKNDKMKSVIYEAVAEILINCRI